MSSLVAPGGPEDARCQREEVKCWLPTILGLEVSREPAPLPALLTISREPVLLPSGWMMGLVIKGRQGMWMAPRPKGASTQQGQARTSQEYQQLTRAERYVPHMALCTQSLASIRAVGSPEHLDACCLRDRGGQRIAWLWSEGLWGPTTVLTNPGPAPHAPFPNLRFAIS